MLLIASVAFPTAVRRAAKAAVPMTNTKLRVLALHSFRTSDQIFKDQFLISGLDKTLSDLWEPVRFRNRNITRQRSQCEDPQPHLQRSRRSFFVHHCLPLGHHRQMLQRSFLGHILNGGTWRR